QTAERGNFGESKLNTLVQKLHDFLAHSSEESEDANSPPALSKTKTIDINSCERNFAVEHAGKKKSFPFILCSY
uniref:DNA helicase n=1 Tax=Strigops habroptila TaxID=2489341 RepID=A0A672U3X2_STRHB